MKIKVALAFSAIVIAIGFSNGCASKGKQAAAIHDGEITVYGRHLEPGNSITIQCNQDLLSIIEEIRSAGGYKSGLFRMRVDIPNNSSNITKIIDIRNLTLREAERTKFPPKTVIQIIDSNILW